MANEKELDVIKDEYADMPKEVVHANGDEFYLYKDGSLEPIGGMHYGPGLKNMKLDENRMPSYKGHYFVSGPGYEKRKKLAKQMNTSMINFTDFEPIKIDDLYQKEEKVNHNPMSEKGINNNDTERFLKSLEKMEKNKEINKWLLSKGIDFKIGDMFTFKKDGFLNEFTIEDVEMSLTSNDGKIKAKRTTLDGKDKTCYFNLKTIKEICENLKKDKSNTEQTKNQKNTTVPKQTPNPNK